MKRIIYFIIFLFSVSCGKTDKDIKIHVYENPKTLNNKFEKQSNLKIEMENVKYIKERDYFAYMHSSNAQFEVLVDDVPAYRFFGKESRNGMGMSGDIPLNACLLKSGEHTIIGRIFPKQGSLFLNYNSYLSLDFSIRESNTLNSVDLFSLEPPKDDYKDGKIVSKMQGLPFYEITTTLGVEVPFNIQGWTNSIDLKKEMDNGNDLKKELQETYKSIRTIIEKKDITTFSELIKDREQLLATAFYISKEQQQKDLQEFLNIIKNPDYELSPIPLEADLHFYGYGKLVTLLTSEREGIIKLINKKNKNEEIILDFYFHRKKTGERLEVIL